MVSFCAALGMMHSAIAWFVHAMSYMYMYLHHTLPGELWAQRMVRAHCYQCCVCGSSRYNRMILLYTSCSAIPSHACAFTMGNEERGGMSQQVVGMQACQCACWHLIVMLPRGICGFWAGGLMLFLMRMHCGALQVAAFGYLHLWPCQMPRPAALLITNY